MSTDSTSATHHSACRGRVRICVQTTIYCKYNSGHRGVSHRSMEVVKDKSIATQPGYQTSPNADTQSNVLQTGLASKTSHEPQSHVARNLEYPTSIWKRPKLLLSTHLYFSTNHPTQRSSPEGSLVHGLDGEHYTEVSDPPLHSCVKPPLASEGAMQTNIPILFP